MHTFPTGAYREEWETNVSQAKRYALVVEDDEVQRRMVRTILEANGFEVLQSDNAEAAQIILE